MRKMIERLKTPNSNKSKNAKMRLCKWEKLIRIDKDDEEMQKHKCVYLWNFET